VRTAVLLLAGSVLVGCGSSQEQAVSNAARAFGEALVAGDAARACTALSPGSVVELEQSAGQECARALPAQDLVVPDRVGGVERYGRQARVTVRSSDGRTDTWFLSRFDGRWLVVAASCRPRPDLPYDCGIEGP
jgi:hypothetical protein